MSDAAVAKSLTPLRANISDFSGISVAEYRTGPSILSLDMRCYHAFDKRFVFH